MIEIVTYPLLPHQKILVIRVLRQMSIKDLSKCSGVHPLKIRRIEFGLSQLRLDAAFKLIKGLNTTPEEIASSHWQFYPLDFPSHIGFGEKIKLLRDDKNLKIDALARAIKISPSCVSRIENNYSLNPTFDLINSFSNYFEVSISWLIGYNNN